MYSFLRKYYIRAGFAVIAVLLAGLFACNDKGVEPEPVDPVDYSVYFWNLGSSQQLYEYHPLTRSIDSSDLAYEPFDGLTVSADGKLLYLAQKSVVTVVDSESLLFVADLPYAPDDPVAVSPDNSMIAITGDDLYVLRADDYSVIFHDTDVTSNGIFSADSRTLYCTGKTGPGGRFYLYRAEFTDSVPKVKRLEFEFASVNHAVPTPDNRKVLLYLRFSTFGYSFQVYDLITDSVIFELNMAPGAGKIAMTPDGRYAFFGNPGTGLIGPPPGFWFMVFDIESNSVIQTIDTRGFVDDTIPQFFAVRHMAVTPDGKWLVAMNGPTPQDLLLFDIRKKKLLDYHSLGRRNISLTNPTVQIAR